MELHLQHPPSDNHQTSDRPALTSVLPLSVLRLQVPGLLGLKLLVYNPPAWKRRDRYDQQLPPVWSLESQSELWGSLVFSQGPPRSHILSLLVDLKCPSVSVRRVVCLHVSFDGLQACPVSPWPVPQWLLDMDTRDIWRRTRDMRTWMDFYTYPDDQQSR